MEMQNILFPENSQTSTSFVAVFLVKITQLLEKEPDLKAPEVLCFMKLHGFVKLRNLDAYYSKMLEAFLIKHTDKHLLQYLPFFPTLGIELNGNYLILNTSPYPRTVSVSLSSVLEAQGLLESGEIVNISDSQRYKMCGNGVVTNVVRAVANKIEENYHSKANI
jgi:hypothetical protein